MKRYRKKNKSKIGVLKFFLIPWAFLFLFFGIAYADYATTLSADSIAVVQKYVSDYVYISQIRLSSASGASSASKGHLNQEAAFSIYSNTCGDYIIYDVDIVNTTIYKAFITSAQVESMFNQNGSTTSGYSVEFLDVVPNETYILPHSTKTIKIKVTNNCSSSDEMVNVYTKFEYSLYKYFDLTITAVPSTAAISMTTSEGTFTGVGTLTHRVHEDDEVSYTVSNIRYATKASEYLMSASDNTINISLDMMPLKHISVVPNVSDQNVQCLANGESIFYTTDYTKSNADVYVGDFIQCSAGENGQSEYYYTYDSGTDTYHGWYTEFTVEDNATFNPVLQERPYIDSSYTNNNYATAVNGTLKNYHPGYYLFKVWGGNGGKGYADKAGAMGDAGYVYGVVYLDYGEVITYSVGGNGQKGDESGKGLLGGANGGGTATYDKSYNYQGGSGGGYSIVTNSAGTILFVAAGGGGGSGPTGALGSYKGGPGGAGGNVSSTSTSFNNGTVFYGSNGGYGYHSSNAVGTGGTTTGGTNSRGTSYSAGSLFQGGHAEGRGGDGGGGLYGGGAGYTNADDGKFPIGNHAYGTGGGGGSSYIYSSVRYTNLPSNIASKVSNMTNPSSATGDQYHVGGAMSVEFISKNSPF